MVLVHSSHVQILFMVPMATNFYNPGFLPISLLHSNDKNMKLLQNFFGKFYKNLSKSNTTWTHLYNKMVLPMARNNGGNITGVLLEVSEDFVVEVEQ